MDLRERKGDGDQLTCHVAVDLRGPQGAAGVRVDGVEARGAANQLVGLAGRLVDGWKQQTERQELSWRRVRSCSLIMIRSFRYTD